MFSVSEFVRRGRNRLDYTIMRSVIPARLWIGNLRDLGSPRAILDAGIAAVVQLSVEETLPQLPRDLVFCHFPLVDGDGNDPAILRLCLHCVAELLTDGVPTLVCCGGGMSRSPTIASAAVSLLEYRPIDEAVRSITADGAIDISPAFWNDVVRVLEGMKRAT